MAKPDKQNQKPKSLGEKIADVVDHVVHPNAHHEADDVKSIDGDADQSTESNDDESKEVVVQNQTHPKFQKFNQGKLTDDK